MLGNEKIIGFLSCLFQRSVCCRQKRAFLKDDFFSFRRKILSIFFLFKERFLAFSFLSKEKYAIFA